MDAGTAPTLERKLAATLDWWREAGVDLLFEDRPRGWLRGPAQLLPAEPADLAEPAADRAAPAPPQPAIGGAPELWPADLAAFAAWWLAEPSLELGGTGRRLAPRGSAEPELMVLVPMPEAEDRDTLLAGIEGRLVERMLAAMGIAPERCYLAAALPRRMAQPDWAGLARAGLGRVLEHHLSLVRPKRLLVLGQGILPLLGHAPAQGPAAAGQTAIQTAAGRVAIPTLLALAPSRLLENARQRALLWRQWLDWTGTDA